MHEPGRVALQLAPVDVRDALVESEGGDRADVLVGVRLQGLAAQRVRDVVAEDLGLADRVLGVGGRLRAGFRGGDVGDGGRVSGRPRVRGAVDGQLGGAFQPASLVEREVGGGEERVGFTPAVHTTVRVGKRAPSLRTATRSTQDSRRVFRRTSMLRRRSSVTV